MSAASSSTVESTPTTSPTASPTTSPTFSKPNIPPQVDSTMAEKSQTSKHKHPYRYCGRAFSKWKLAREHQKFCAKRPKAVVTLPRAGHRRRKIPNKYPIHADRPGEPNTDQ